MFSFPIIILFALLVIIICVSYLMVSSSGEANKKQLEDIDANMAQVQCPQCQRWKALEPLEVKKENAPRVDASTGAFYPGVTYLETRFYKCAYCGHHWQEEFQTRTR